MSSSSPPNHDSNAASEQFPLNNRLNNQTNQAPTNFLPFQNPHHFHTLLPPHNQQHSQPQPPFNQYLQPQLLASTPFFNQNENDQASPYITSALPDPSAIPSTFSLQSPTLQLMESSIGFVHQPTTADYSTLLHSASSHYIPPATRHASPHNTDIHRNSNSNQPHFAPQLPTFQELPQNPPSSSSNNQYPIHSPQINPFAQPHQISMPRQSDFHLNQPPPPTNPPNINNNGHPYQSNLTTPMPIPMLAQTPTIRPPNTNHLPPYPTNNQIDLTAVPIVRVPANVPVQTADKFIALLYKYYYENGYKAIKDTRITKLATKFFAIIFTTLLMIIFDWWAIVPCLRYAGGGDGTSPETDPCNILKFSRLYSNFSFAHIFAIFYACSVLVYWIWQFFGFLTELRLYREIRRVFHRAGITDHQLAHVSWSYVIQQLSNTLANPNSPATQPNYHQIHTNPALTAAPSDFNPTYPHLNTFQQQHQFPPTSTFPHSPTPLPNTHFNNLAYYPNADPTSALTNYNDPAFLQFSNHSFQPPITITSPAHHIQSPYIFTNVTKPYLSKEIMKIDNVMMFLLKDDILKLTFPSSSELRQLGMDIIRWFVWIFKCCGRAGNRNNSTQYESQFNALDESSSINSGGQDIGNYETGDQLDHQRGYNPKSHDGYTYSSNPTTTTTNANTNTNTNTNSNNNNPNLNNPGYQTYQTLSPHSQNNLNSNTNPKSPILTHRKVINQRAKYEKNVKSPPTAPTPTGPSSDQFFAALNNVNFTKAQNELKTHQKQQLLKQQQTLYGTTFANPTDVDATGYPSPPSSTDIEDGNSSAKRASGGARSDDLHDLVIIDETVADYPEELQYIPPFSLKHVFLSPLLNWILREIIISPFFTQIDGAKMPIPLRYYPSLTAEEQQIEDRFGHNITNGHVFNNATQPNSTNLNALDGFTLSNDLSKAAMSQNNQHQRQHQHPQQTAFPSASIYIPPFSKFLRDNLPREVNIPAGIHFVYSPEVLHSQNRTNFLQYQHNLDMVEQYGVEPNCEDQGQHVPPGRTENNTPSSSSPTPSSQSQSDDFPCEHVRSMPNEMKADRNMLITNVRSQLRFLSIISFFFLPVIIIFQLFSLIVNNIYTIQQQRSTLSTSYQWSLYSKYILRSFNELQHTFHIRLVYAMKYSRLYLKQFTPPRYVYVSQFLSFVCGCGILVAVFVTFIDARSVLVESSNRWLLILLAVCTITVTICRGLIDEYSFFHDNLGDIDDVRQLQYDPYIHSIREIYQKELQTQGMQMQGGQTDPNSTTYTSDSAETPTKLTSFVTPSIYHDLASQSFFKHRPYITFSKVIELCRFPLLSLKYANSMVMRRFIETFLQTTGVTWMYTLIDTIFTPLIIITKVTPIIPSLFDQLTRYYQFEFQKRVELLFQHHSKVLYDRYLQIYGPLLAHKQQLELAQHQQQFEQHQRQQQSEQQQQHFDSKTSQQSNTGSDQPIPISPDNNSMGDQSQPNQPHNHNPPPPHDPFSGHFSHKLEPHQSRNSSVNNIQHNNHHINHGENHSTNFNNGSFHPTPPLAEIASNPHPFNQFNSTHAYHGDDPINQSLLQSNIPTLTPQHLATIPSQTQPDNNPNNNTATHAVNNDNVHLHTQPDGQVVAFNTDHLEYAPHYQHSHSQRSHNNDKDEDFDEDYNHDASDPNPEEQDDDDDDDDDRLSTSSFEPLD